MTLIATLYLASALKNCESHAGFRWPFLPSLFTPNHSRRLYGDLRPTSLRPCKGYGRAIGAMWPQFFRDQWRSRGFNAGLRGRNVANIYKGRPDFNLSPNPRGFSCRRCRSLASVIGLRSMSSSGPLQLPQAQAKSTSQALPQQKPLSLPTQSKGIDSTSSNGSKEDGKPDVKDTPSVPPSITEQTLSSMHGIVPTLQYVLSQISGQANTEQKYCGNGKPRSEIGFKNHCASRTEC